MQTVDPRLLRVADDYLTAVCELAVRAKDATSPKRLEDLRNALDFATEVTKDIHDKPF